MDEHQHETTLTGGCRCGQVRYAAIVSNPRSVVCACPDCQMASGSVLSVAMGVKDDNFTLTSGEEHVRSYADTGESGASVHRAFCVVCGSQLFARPDAAPGLVSLRIASLDEPFTKTPAFSIFTNRIPAWVQLVDVHDADPEYTE